MAKQENKPKAAPAESPPAESPPKMIPVVVELTADRIINGITRHSGFLLIKGEMPADIEPGKIGAALAQHQAQIRKWKPIVKPKPKPEPAPKNK